MSAVTMSGADFVPNIRFTLQAVGLNRKQVDGVHSEAVIAPGGQCDSCGTDWQFQVAQWLVTPLPGPTLRFLTRLR